MEDKSITLISAKLMFYAGLKATAMNDDESLIYAEKALLDLYARLTKHEKEAFRGFVACVGMADGATVSEIREMIFMIETTSTTEWNDLIKNAQ